MSFAVTLGWGNDNLLARGILSYAMAIFIFILLDSALDRRASIFMVVFSYYNIGLFIFPGMLHCAQGYFPFFELAYAPGAVLDVSMLIAVYSTSVVAGFLVRRQTTKFAPIDSTLVSSSLSDTKIIVWSMASIIISVICIAALGIQVFLTRRADLDLVVVDQNPLSQILNVLPQILSFCSAAIVIERAVSRRNPFIIMLSFPLVILAFVVSNPLTVARFWLFGMVLIIIYASRIIVSVSHKLIFVATAVIFQILILPLEDSMARGVAGSQFIFNPLGYISSSGDFDGLQSSLNVYLLTEKEGLSYGYRFLGAALTFVPRNVWPAKPYATGQAAAESMGLSFSNLSAPIPAEIYVNFGIIGVIAIPFVIGYIGKMFDRAAQRAILIKAPMTIRLLYGGVIGFVVIISRGSLLAIMSPVYLYFGVVAFWYNCHSRRYRNSSRNYP
jgi:hypothetical protein